MPNETFKKGDFVKLKRGPAGSVGVVWQIHSKNKASVEVYWSVGETSRSEHLHEPRDLVLVPAHEAPQDAIELKESLG
jgi:hypothetical protein